MTKAALCTHCVDIVSPYRDWRNDRRFRWCECDHMGVRWRDGFRGLLEVTALHGPEHVRVLGLNNMFLQRAALVPPASWGGGRDLAEPRWRDLHDECAAEVEPHYLFHKDRRNCWALLVRVGESGDVSFVDWPAARAAGLPVEQQLRQLCGQRMTRAGDGSLTDSDTVWPSEILAVLTPATAGGDRTGDSSEDDGAAGEVTRIPNNHPGRP